MQPNEKFREVIDKLGWDALRATLSATHMAGASGVTTVHLDCFMKYGSRTVIESEAMGYRKLENRLGTETFNRMFPRSHYVELPDSEEAAMFLEPIRGENLEELVVKMTRLALEHGSGHPGVIALQRRITDAVRQVLAKLELLHGPVAGIDHAQELRAFVCELSASLIENLQRAKINVVVPDLARQEKYWQSGIATLAHRDLAVVNIIANETDTRFIDPRTAVPNGTSGSAFASPAIDLVALSISLERKELELQHTIPGMHLEVRVELQKAITSLLERQHVTRDLLGLMEVVTRSSYAACACVYCLASERVWLYEHMYEGTMRGIATL